MIIGIGVDIIEVSRLDRAVHHPKTGERFRQRVFTPGEDAYCQRRQNSAAQSYAARFAAKEAVMKAMGGGFSWQDIEVMRHSGTAPTIILHRRAAERARELGVQRFHLSLSHSATQAIAYVIAEA